MRTVLLGIVVSLAAVGCTGVGDPSAPAAAGVIQIHPTDSPFVRVTSGAVSGLVPQGWTATAVDPAAMREGFLASPDPGEWRGANGPVTGMAATWVDATQVGVPSDFYYLAATGPLLSELVASPGCRPWRQQIAANHAPAFATGRGSSPGDYVARGEGVCRPDGRPHVRWSYFVAAPGFGPTRTIGIPGSGLYVVVAVTRQTPGANRRLSHLLGHVRFGDAGIGDFMRSARVGLV